MGDRNNISDPVERADARPPPPSADSLKLVVPKTADKAGRSACSDQDKIPDWSSYRSWVDKASRSWDEKKYAQRNRVPVIPRGPTLTKAQSLCPIRDWSTVIAGAISLHWHVST